MQASGGEAVKDAGAASPRRFRLLGYFTVATLVSFAIVGIVLFTLQHGEEDFFSGVQREQSAFVAGAQAELARQTEAAARQSLLAQHEAGHVDLALVVSHLLWDSDFGPLVREAQRFDLERCRALEAAARKPCLAAVGERIRALPRFAAADAKAYRAMSGTRVFKIKVWDLRGLCVYSSEQRQVGDDGSANRGWQAAAAGRAASELTHRDRFSAFEGVVENRDLISSYVPVRDEAGRILGVFELYSDVTPFLEGTREASRRFAAIAAANQARLDAAAQDNERRVVESSNRFLAIVIGLLVLLYAVSLAIVAVGQRIIDRQQAAHEQAVRREMLWHREKMAALAAMAARVSHEVGNPLAAITGLAQQLPPADGRPILEQAQRIATMTRRIADFAAARGTAPEWVDLNEMLRSVCEFVGFDRRLRGTPIAFEPDRALPAVEVVPDHLNEVLLGALQACAEGQPATLSVRTETRDGGRVAIRFERGGTVDAARLEPLARRVEQMGGTLVAAGGAVEIVLPSGTA